MSYTIDLYSIMQSFFLLTKNRTAVLINFCGCQNFFLDQKTKKHGSQELKSRSEFGLSFVATIVEMTQSYSSP